MLTIISAAQIQALSASKSRERPQGPFST